MCKILECSSKGDRRFSAFYARISFFNLKDSIESIYQGCKRFDGKRLSIKKSKGRKPTSVEIDGLPFDVEVLTPLYKTLWYIYLSENPHLVKYAKKFDRFTDMFRGKSVNCQADVINTYINNRMDLEESIRPFLKSIGKEDILSKAACVTGHRPNSLFGYNSLDKYKELIKQIDKSIINFYTKYNVRTFYSGGAQGVDLLFAERVNKIRDSKYSDIYSVVCLPNKEHGGNWINSGIFTKHHLNTILLESDEYFYVDKGNFSIGSLFKRNHVMVDKSDYVLGICKQDLKEKKGGTVECLNYAVSKNKAVVILHPYELKYTKKGVW